MKFASRVDRIQPSMTMAVIEKAATLRSKGIDVVDFGAGEPDYGTPEHVKQAAVQAMKDGHTRYTKNAGIDELREAICHKLSRDNNLEYTPDQILVSNGAKHVLFNSMMAMLSPGDEIIIFSPYWVTFPEMAKLTGATPVIIETKDVNHFEPDLDEVKEAVSSNTRAILMNSPSNPSGMVYSEETIHGIYTICAENDLFLISDECYERVTYGSEAISPAKYEDEPTHVVTVQSLSKSYAMTGWRVGYAAANADLIKNMAKIQSQSASHANSIAQYAAVTALSGDQSFIGDMVKEYHNRRDYVLQRLAEIPDVTCNKPEGAFYVFPNLSAYYGKQFNGTQINNSLDMTGFLLDEANVAVVPGGAFGAGNHIRISYATSMRELERGLDRMERALGKLQ